jgi:hypothetical protein
VRFTMIEGESWYYLHVGGIADFNPLTNFMRWADVPI